MENKLSALKTEEIKYFLNKIKYLDYAIRAYPEKKEYVFELSKLRNAVLRFDNIELIGELYRAIKTSSYLPYIKALHQHRSSDELSRLCFLFPNLSYKELTVTKDCLLDLKDSDHCTTFATNVCFDVNDLLSVQEIIKDTKNVGAFIHFAKSRGWSDFEKTAKDMKNWNITFPQLIELNEYYEKYNMVMKNKSALLDNLKAYLYDCQDAIVKCDSESEFATLDKLEELFSYFDILCQHSQYLPNLDKNVSSLIKQFVEYVKQSNNEDIYEAFINNVTPNRLVPTHEIIQLLIKKDCADKLLEYCEYYFLPEQINEMIGNYFLSIDGACADNYYARSFLLSCPCSEKLRKQLEEKIVIYGTPAECLDLIECCDTHFFTELVNKCLTCNDPNIKSSARNIILRASNFDRNTHLAEQFQYLVSSKERKLKPEYDEEFTSIYQQLLKLNEQFPSTPEMEKSTAEQAYRIVFMKENPTASGKDLLQRSDDTQSPVFGDKDNDISLGMPF